MFIQLWHVVFGLTNKYLAEDGVIYDSYRDGKGYLPALFKGDILMQIVKEIERWAG